MTLLNNVRELESDVGNLTSRIEDSETLLRAQHKKNKDDLERFENEVTEVEGAADDVETLYLTRLDASSKKRAVMTLTSSS